MPDIHNNNIKHTGLTDNVVKELQEKYGKNIFHIHKQRRFYHIVLEILTEPMFVMLVLACTLYFVLGENSEGLMMLTAMVMVAGISFYQDIRSTVALDALKEFTEPKTIVVRNGKQIPVSSADLVPGDVIYLHEGNRVPADGLILESNDLSVNEAVITGESLPVNRNETAGNNLLFQGTSLVSGRCYAKLTATGSSTQFGKIGKLIQPYAPSKTHLQHQVNKFVKSLAIFGILSFVTIFLFKYFNTGLLAQSVLWGLTLAMAAIPEEIPVAFSSFMALGSYRMSRMGIITRQPQTIENLGSVDVICLDKTGTITENRMTIKNIFEYDGNKLIDAKEYAGNSSVLYYAQLASEVDPFDEMEKAVFRLQDQYVKTETRVTQQQLSEFPLEGKPPMMTHVYEGHEQRLIAGKGAPERIFNVCRLKKPEQERMMELVRLNASKGFRVIGIASAVYPQSGDLPSKQDDFDWKFEGLLSFYDPPRTNIKEVFQQFNEAGIEIKLLTGDYMETAEQIAFEVGMKNINKSLTGEEVMSMSPEKLNEAVVNTNLFARMFPEAKVKVIEILKAQKRTVAMTGDGVNDAPALQLADVGIAMGKGGSAMAVQTSDLVLTDDNISKVVEAISHGRRIFNNLKKAVRYIISIHIPLLLTVTIPLVLGWKYPDIFTPIHVIFLELIMGPTCSIFFEREPSEPHAMKRAPRARTASLFSKAEIIMSIVQGLMITAGTLWIYHYSVQSGFSIGQARNMVFTTLLISNLCLTFVMRSSVLPIYRTLRYKNNLAAWIVIVSIGFILIIHFVPMISKLFGMSTVPVKAIFVSMMIAFASVFWIEIWKTVNLYRSSHKTI